MLRKMAFILALFFLFCFSVFANPLDQIKVKPEKGKVVLTFDDGPNPIDTPKIIRILNRYHIHAVFFVMGRFAKKYPNLIQLIHRNGDVVANHTMTHPKLTRIPPSQYSYQILEVNQIVKNIINKVPRCVRPPFGLSNRRIRQFIRQHGMRVIMWDLNSFDYRRPGVNKLASWVIKNTHSGYDILLHDGPKNRSQTVAALPLMIEGLQKKGLGFDVICQ